MYQDLMRQIAIKMKRFGLRFQPPSSAGKVERLKHDSVRELGHHIPDEYVSFLLLANGLDWNGLVVYASERSPIIGHTDRFIEGFIEGNLDYRDFEPLKDYLIFADDGLALYTYRISAAEYQAVTSVGLTLLESFRSFDELLRNALQCHL